ncbi:Gas vesicle synthesis protein GvpO [Pelotomaculum sp. FP]|uniref:gas vesicle protein GvpO n=1 Tax=Pelotomaculum sp. FP TaxID=261474 RepID=UPI001065A77D|nr:gas vesicle protein GvpO [Pelotomaculum sp. FP]TEB15412.1 Gas vesicle synthesis protein GvpO [Pelotomaculum sp. FP]
MVIKKVIITVQDFFSEVLGKPGKIVGVSREEDCWKVKIEVPEEVEYMRRHAKGDLMAIYDVSLNNKYEVTNFERIALMERGSLTIYPIEPDKEEEKA